MFRPVLELLDASTLGASGLKAVTLSLNGGSLGSSNTIQILGKTGSAFSAPAADGLSRPSGDTDSYFKWLGSDGKLYEPGDEVPAEVTGLTALWAMPSYSVTLHPNGGTVAAGKEVTDYTYGQSVTLPGAGDMTRTGYTFGGWYPNDAFTGTAVSAIGSTETGNKEFWAQWTVNQYTLTVRPENGQADITVTQDYGTPIPEPVLNREGYQFQGWDKPFPATMPAENGTVTARWLDIAAPTGSIRVASNSWKTLLNDISFGLFFKEAQTVTVTASDNSGEPVTVEYLLSDRALNAAQLPGMTFTPYSGPFAVNPDNEYVVYARLTDTTGNVAYLSSDGLVLDATSPGISGIENGRTYCGARLVTVTEKYLASVTVNGQPVTLDGNSQFTLNPAKGTQTVTVTDRAGSKTAVTVTVNDGHSYEWQYINGEYRERCKYCGDETGAVRRPDNSTSPKTGDQSQVILGVALLCASAAGIVGIILYGRKLRKKDPME